MPRGALVDGMPLAVSGVQADMNVCRGWAVPAIALRERRVDVLGVPVLWGRLGGKPVIGFGVGLWGVFEWRRWL